MKINHKLNVPSVDAAFTKIIHDRQLENAAKFREVLDNCKSRRLALDVGAYVGEYSYFLAQNFLNVVSYEPHHDAYACLQGNLKSYPNVQAVRIALSSGRSVGYLGRQSSDIFGNFNLLEKSGPKTTRVPVMSVDDLDLENVDLIRIASFADWEKVLIGALKTISKYKPGLWLSNDPSALPTDAVMHLGSLGYRKIGRSHLYISSQKKDGFFDVSDEVVLQNNGKKWLTLRKPKQDTKPERYFGAVVDRFYTIASQRTSRSNKGISDIFSISVPHSFNANSKHKINIPNREVFKIDPISKNPIEINSSAEIIAAEITDGTIVLKLHWSAAGQFSHVLVEAEIGERDRIAVGKIPIHSLDNIEDVRLDIPDVLLSPERVALRIKLLSSEHEVPEVVRILEAPRDKVSSKTTRCYLNHGGGGNDVIRAMAEGLKCPLSYAEGGLRSGIPIVWGVLRGSRDVLLQAEERGRLWMYIDHAYFGRGHLANYRISLNRFEAGAVRACPSDRLDRLGIPVEPWKTEGRTILVCPPTEHFIKAHGVGSWLEDTLAELAKYTDRPIVVRQKPQPGEPSIPLAEALGTAYALVTHSSNVAIEAAVAGVPVYVSPTSAAAPVGNTSLATIEERSFPDRRAWLQHLAYSQFSFDEIKLGRAIDILLEHADMPLVTEYAI
ncbi:FkbM family methyltransferase [Methylobacterium tarhaniae]|uniref:FkbM family methyltransferase n=1 Tax=Methylobacterium tarhaniae TaxID=1187852 RepID=UPI0009F8CDC4|nr:FkbM family methyltransferase [Methylobacterium tarhaniae]